jgi:microcystin-dependent protein
MNWSQNEYALPSTANGTMSGAALQFAGGNQPHANIQPVLTINFIIALSGIYPARN